MQTLHVSLLPSASECTTIEIRKEESLKFFIAQKNMVVVYFIIFFSLSTCGMGFVIMCALKDNFFLSSSPPSLSLVLYRIHHNLHIE